MLTKNEAFEYCETYKQCFGRFLSILERKKLREEIEALGPIEQGQALQDLHDRVWLDVHIEGMLAYDEAYSEGNISPGQFISAMQAHLRKLRRAYPQMDD